jgi:hypothetical protein
VKINTGNSVSENSNGNSMSKNPGNNKSRHKLTFKKKLAVAGAIIIICIGFLCCDLYRSRLDLPPIFAVPILRYENGSTDYYGIGYKVWKDVNIINGNTAYYLTAWFVPKYTIDVTT